MQVLIQPEGKRWCGQYCVAMLAGITPEESASHFLWSRNGTTTIHVARALMRLGFDPDIKLRRFKDETELPTTCILKVRWPGRRNWHWAVYNSGSIHCPDLGLHPALGDYLKTLGAKASSYLKVNP